METKRKKRISNIIMAALAVIIVVSGIMAVGLTKGWIGGSSSQMECTEITGTVNIQRNGVIYALEEDVVMEAGDNVEVMNASSAEFDWTGATVGLNEYSLISLKECGEASLSMELEKGEIFGDITGRDNAVKLAFHGHETAIKDAVFSVSAQTGSSMINVYYGSVAVTTVTGDDIEVNAGESVTLILHEGGTVEYDKAEIIETSLNQFVIGQLLASNCDDLCFTEANLKEVTEQRAEENKAVSSEKGKIITAKDTTEDEDGKTDESAAAADKDHKTEPPEKQDEDDKENTAEDKNGEEENENTSSKEEFSQEPENSEAESTDEQVSSEEQAVPVNTCTIQIRCNTILSNMENLREGKEKYVPSNGIILSTSTVEFQEGETVFDVLKRACSYTGIQLEYSYTPMYESYYIEGINHLYEFECGAQSGWMYKVNGWFPNYGCSNYELKDGDSIVWMYTCNGLGADIGGSNF